MIAARSRKRDAPECWHIQFFCMCMIVNYFKHGGGGGSRTIRRVDNTQVIDSRNCHNGQKGSIARSIVRLLYENALRSGVPQTEQQRPQYCTDSLGRIETSTQPPTMAGESTRAAFPQLLNRVQRQLASPFRPRLRRHRSQPPEPHRGTGLC